MDLGLAGRVAIVTGASRGLGLAAVRALVAEGVRVVAAARSTADLEELAAAAPGGTVLAAPCDMTDRDAVAGLVPAAMETFGRLDIVVNNAGIAPASPFLGHDIATWERVLAVNVLAPVALCQAAGEIFLGQGSGKVVNVASTSGLRGKPLLAAYSSSKGAMLRFTEALAGEWARKGIQVNAIAPGAFETAAQQAVLDDPDTLRARVGKIPVRRMGRPEEIGPLVCYLCSPMSDFVTGATFVIDGGEANKL
jgi:2-dehydro-3-deoxy-D-gluconate 5-dehydrogenase